MEQGSTVIYVEALWGIVKCGRQREETTKVSFMMAQLHPLVGRRGSHGLILYIISVAIVAQSIVLQAVSWGNHAAQESTRAKE